MFARLQRFPYPVRLLLKVLLGLVAIEVLWLVVANVFIMSGGPLGALINRKPEKIRIEWESAWSWWPGDLHVRGFVLRGIDFTNQFVVEFDRAYMQVGLLALVDKRFLAERVRVEGGSIRLRKVPKEPGDLKKKDVVPEIPWAEFEIRDPELERQLAAARLLPPKKLWAADLRGIVAADLREFWIDEYRYRGEIDVQGGFFFRPKELLDISGGKVDVRPGRVTLGADDVLLVRSGLVDFGLRRVDLVENKGLDILKQLTGRAQVDAGVANIRFVDFYLGRLPGLDIRSGPGDLYVDLIIDPDGTGRGELVLAGKDVRGVFRAIALHGDLKIKAHLRQFDLRTGTVDLSGTSLELSGAAVANDGRAASSEGRWSATVQVEEASGKLGDAYGLSGKVKADIKDTLPLISLFEARRNLPKSAEKIFEMQNLHASARVRASRGELDLRAIRIEGQDFDLKGVLLLREDSAKPGDRGILYVRRGPLSFGLEKGGDRKVKITHPKKWFENHPLGQD